MIIKNLFYVQDILNGAFGIQVNLNFHPPTHIEGRQLVFLCSVGVENIDFIITCADKMYLCLYLYLRSRKPLHRQSIWVSLAWDDMSVSLPRPHHRPMFMLLSVSCQPPFAFITIVLCPRLPICTILMQPKL